MSGLGLTAALQGYQQGVAWNNQQKQIAVDNKQRQTIQDANDAGAAALQQAHEQDIAQQQQQWTQAGNDPSTFQPKPFQMTPQILLAGMHARSDAIAKSGDMDLWTHNEAATAPIRNTIRQQVIGKALADYNATGDGAALAKTVYPTVHDGVDITDVTRGVDASQAGQIAANNGQAPVNSYKIALSNGKSYTMTGDQIAGMAHDALLSPDEWGKYEFQSRLQKAEQDRQIALAQAKAKAEGDQARQTEGVKGQFHLQGIGLQGENALKVGQGNNEATVKAAGISAQGHVDAADILAGSRVEAAGLRASGAGTKDPSKIVQSKNEDSDGYQYFNMRDGSIKYPTNPDGSRVKTMAFSKRLDSIKKTLRGTLDGSNMTEDQLNQAAMQSMGASATASAPAASGLIAAPAKPTGKLIYNPATGGFN